MTTFIYQACDNNGLLVHGEYEGVNREEVIEHLTKRSLTPLSIETLTSHAHKHNILAFTFFDYITPIDILFLVRNLATTVKAGLSIVECLDIIIVDTQKKIMKKILQTTQAMVKNGQPLSAGFDIYKDSFPPVFIGMLKAGELSGQLDKNLSELGRFLSKEYALRSKVKSAMIYPIILLIASGGIVTLLLMFVLPRLAKAFTSSGVQLPWITKVLLEISHALTYSYTLDCAALIILIWFFSFFHRTRTGKKILFLIISHTPIANALIKKLAVVRFARTFGNLIGSGLSAIESLELSSESIGNQSYTRAIESTIVEVKNGVAISAALAKFPKLFPRLLISLMIVGERTGSLQDILASFSDFYEEEVDTTLKDLTTILEPALLLFMGLMIGAIAVAILLPIYQLVGNFV